MHKSRIIGIDLGATNLKLAVFSLGCKLLSKEVLSTTSFLTKQSLIKGIIASVLGILRSKGLKKGGILGVGLGLPGPIDRLRGIVHFFPNIPGWREVRLERILSKELGLPVFLDNDAKLAALAEHKFGSAKGFRNALCLTLGTGVGGGLIIEGALYRGANNASSEIGHLQINEVGPRCNCGGVACLESYIGNKRLLAEGRKLFKRAISLEELSRLAKKQNKSAVSIWRNAGRRLGIALTGAVNLLNLDAVIIGGGVAGAGKILFDEVRNTVNSRAMSIQAGQLKILKAKLGNHAGMTGAAIMVKEALCR